MRDLARWALLFDFYGELLTERQRQAFELHHHHDLSYAEVAQELGISRPAALDLVRRAERSLTEFERAVKAVEQFGRERRRLQLLAEHLSRGELAEARALVARWQEERGEVDV
jgi:predicted DNA-binding protein YlxM (UPF0122 family)